MEEERRENTNVEVEKKKSLDGFLVSDSVVGFNGSWTTPIGRESTWNIDLDWEHLEFWYPQVGASCIPIPSGQTIRLPSASSSLSPFR